MWRSRLPCEVRLGRLIAQGFHSIQGGKTGAYEGDSRSAYTHVPLQSAASIRYLEAMAFIAPRQRDEAGVRERHFYPCAVSAYLLGNAA